MISSAHPLADTCSQQSRERWGTLLPFIVSKPGKYTEDQFTANWDREFRGGNDKISARFFFSNGEQLLPFGAGGLAGFLGGTLASSISAGDLNFPYDIPLNDRFFSINETHLFSPAVVNDFRFGFVRINNSLINTPPITADDLGIDRPTSNVTKSIYKFSLSSFQMGPTPPADQFQIQNNYNFVDTLSWVKGRSQHPVGRRLHSRQSRQEVSAGLQWSTLLWDHRQWRDRFPALPRRLGYRQFRGRRGLQSQVPQQ